MENKCIVKLGLKFSIFYMYIFIRVTFTVEVILTEFHAIENADLGKLWIVVQFHAQNQATNYKIL